GDDRLRAPPVALRPRDRRGARPSWRSVSGDLYGARRGWRDLRRRLYRGHAGSSVVPLEALMRGPAWFGLAGRPCPTGAGRRYPACRYIRVVVMLAWPSCCWISRSCAPRLSACAANEWRSRWGVMGLLIPASLAYDFISSQKPWRVSRSPRWLRTRATVPESRASAGRAAVR